MEMSCGQREKKTPQNIIANEEIWDEEESEKEEKKKKKKQ
jgi:hypothetical protein